MNRRPLAENSPATIKLTHHQAHRFLDFCPLEAPNYAHMKTAIDDLPAVSVSRLRALGEITAETKATTIAFGEVAFNVALSLRRFPNGGSWSLFMCPCGRRARILRLFEDGLSCSQCLEARGLRSSRRADPHREPRGLSRTADPRAPE